MTIAACYLCPEGVVLGADSTATFPTSSGGSAGHFNFTQKLFEVGEGGSLGIVTWGIGGLGAASYRTLIARLGDEFATARPQTVQDAAWRWSALVWSEYCNAFGQARNRAKEISAKEAKSPEEERELNDLIAATLAGFCIGGCCSKTRDPEAFEIWLYPTLESPDQPKPIPVGTPKFWGYSNLIDRLSYGMDSAVFHDVLTSGKWTGTPDDLLSIATKNKLAPHGILPIREAIDWVYSSIYTTIKGFKFSRLDPVCGGPIEIAAITTDRRLRWVRHKGLDAAIT
jgi:hypothetical protein